MRMTVLGCWSPFPAPGEACLGYLLEHEGSRVLLECGNGVLGKLTLHTAIEELDAVVLSHFHSDHAGDALILRYGVRSLQRLGLRKGPLRVYAPGEPIEEFQRLHYQDALEPVAVGPGEKRDIGPFQFQFFSAQHPLPALSMRISAGGKTLAYTGDSGRSASLLTLAEQADVLVAEASLREEDDVELREGHLTGGQGGALAQEAGAKRLILTHFFPLFDAGKRQQEAQQYYAGPVEVARSGAAYHI